MDAVENVRLIEQKIVIMINMLCIFDIKFLVKFFYYSQLISSTLCLRDHAHLFVLN